MTAMRFVERAWWSDTVDDKLDRDIWLVVASD